MAWIADDFWSHPKAANLPDKAWRVCVSGILYSSGYGTHGRLDPGQQALIGSTKKTREILIKNGLWEEDSSGDVLIHDWDAHNRKRDERKARDRARKRAERAAASAGQSAGTSEGTSQGPSTPTACVETVETYEVTTDKGSSKVLEEVLSSSETNYEQTENRKIPAAAEAGPTEPDILEACRRFGADKGVVFPLADQLQAEQFGGVVTKMARKQARGSADDVPALFVDLLKRELVRHRHARIVMPAAPLDIATRLPEGQRPRTVTGDDWIVTVVPTLIHHKWDRVEKFVLNRGESEAWTPEQLERRLIKARRLHAMSNA